MVKLTVFLGNPGDKYKKTRHNAARLFCDSLNIPGSWSEKFNGLINKQNNNVYFCPLTYMNESGIAVQKVASFYNIDSKNILIVHDDLELKFGETRLQSGGGLGGHNGLRSVKQHIGTDQFFRLRIGIGRPPEHIDVASFVLLPFTSVEEISLCGIFREAQKLLEKFNEE